MSNGEKSTFAWGQVAAAPVAAVSLADVMSEELAGHLETQELAILAGGSKSLVESVTESPLLPERNHDTTDDFMIAQLLQKQFDKEFDEALHVEENHVNGTSKVRVSYSKYRMVPEQIIWDDSDEDEEDVYFTQDDRKRDWDLFETKDKELGAMPRCGYKKLGEKMITKHDKELSQRENAKRIMEFPPGILTGDGGGFDMQLSNKVYNKIRNFSVKEGKRKHRIQDKEERAVTEQAVDPKTRVLLFKLINGGVLDAINGIVSTGKEAVIMHADGGPGPDDGTETPMNVPKECAVKVFKTTLNEFKTRDKYIRDDYRFRDRFGKQNPRKIIHMWAEKELHNLMKMARGGIRVPEVVVLKNHVLVMSFIGREGRPAPKLKDAVEHMSMSDLATAYTQVEEMMVTLYNTCHLVHADLSEYNILWYDSECWFIDVSQSVEPIHPSGLTFLFRDCTNIVNFFSKYGHPNVPSVHQLFNTITGLGVTEGTEDEILAQIHGYQKHQKPPTTGRRHHHQITAADDEDGRRGDLQDEDEEEEGGLGVEDNFEYCWQQAAASRGGAESGAATTPARNIPGHHRAKSDKFVAKSPRSPKSPNGSGPLSKSPGRSPGSSSHQSGKSPGSEFVGLTDESLRNLKISLLTETSSGEQLALSEEQPEPSHRVTVVKFDDKTATNQDKKT